MTVYAVNEQDVCLSNSDAEVSMASGGSSTGMKRKSFFVDEQTLRRAKRLLGVDSEAEVVRLSVERVVEMEEFWQFMNKTRRSLPPGSMESP
ncbi:hypothetical protein WMF31_31185 [Sorangium sp. So ce1036]|uniref:hypothetical protein n=1 Tax=Sorangium sp. So ce1036 TaxID=3133328 RepID=UPI003EFE8EB6